MKAVEYTTNISENGVIMKRKHFPIIIEQDVDGEFIVTCPVFKGCHSYGSTIDEAIGNITEAIGSCIEDTIVDDYNQFVGVRDIEIAV
ncbi:type II toxin-antitoxin system HicB family antitoxin [Desulfobacula sp.]|jgi:predicted RNase H-like HicB family nuclease|uniref:type II toxin-antitoxin system HicB family antitoxin n=1 Tax=Desulfobacula sp. TaxID=2593537 RepID=UPI0027148E44|nr:type II toxin-antitoxin system HicB family antitoxin [Desulfobacula sp.]